MEEILIFGATGYIGNNLVRYLNKLNGLSISIFRRPSSSLKDLVDCKYKQYVGDLFNQRDLSFAVKDCSGIINLAAERSLLAKQRWARQEVNVYFVELLVDTILQQNPRARLIHCSSAGTIGLAKGPRVLDEVHPFNGGDIHYFLTKKQAEEIVCSGVTRGLNAVIVNPATVIGGCGMRGIQLDTIKKAVSGKLRYYPSGGTSISFVEDVVKGVYSAYLSGRMGERYILGGHNISFKDYFEKLAHLTNNEPPRIRLPGRLLPIVGALCDLFDLSFGKDSALLSVCYGYYSSEKAVRELGYEITPLEDGIKKIIHQIALNQLIGISREGRGS